MLIKAIVFTVFIFILQHVLKLGYHMGFHQHFNKHYPGQCQPVKGIGLSSEAFHVFEDGLTFITSGVRLQQEPPIKLEFYRKNNVVGRIYLFDFNSNKIETQELNIVEDNGFTVKTFAPHGISGWTDKATGNKYIFVVNHVVDLEDAVEKFLYLPATKQLKHVKSYTHETMIMLNDVVATGEDSFYYTNYGTTQNPKIFMMQILTMYSWATVGYYDGKSYRIVLDGMQMPNGIAMSHDNKFVYICMNLNKQLLVTERQSNDDLKIKQAFPLYTIPDNVNIDVKTDDLYIGAHPIMHKIISHIEDIHLRSPSQVLKLNVKNGNITGVTELFYDHGDLITASTSAIVYDNKLLIGSIIDTLVYCDVKVPL